MKRWFSSTPWDSESLRKSLPSNQPDELSGDPNTQDPNTQDPNTQDPSSQDPSSQDPSSQASPWCSTPSFSSEIGKGEAVADTMASPIRCQRHCFAPIHYTKGYQYPLVVWLHNDHHNHRQIDEVMPHISLRNYVGVGVCGNRSLEPTGFRFGWHDSNAGVAAANEAVSNAITAASSTYSIHPERIILAGYQAGGTMALRLAMMNPDQFSAVVSLGGRMPSSWTLRDFDGLRQRRLPMLWQWSLGNPAYTQPGLTEDCRMAMQLGTRVEIRQYPGDEEMDTVVLSDVNEWIMRTVVDPLQGSSDDSQSVPISYSVN